MSIQLVFSTGKPYPNTEAFREQLGTKQNLRTAASETTPDPDTVRIQISSNTLTVVFEGVSLSDAPKSDVDAWSDSITSALPLSVETKRQDIPRGR